MLQILEYTIHLVAIGLITLLTMGVIAVIYAIMRGE